MAFDIFGFSFGRKDEGLFPDGGLTGSSPSTLSFTAPENYDGTQVLETGGFMSSVYDFGGSFIDENSLVRQYRGMSLYPEVDMAIEISSGSCGHFITIFQTLLHEMVHLALYVRGDDDFDQHGAKFMRIKDVYSELYNFDPKAI